MSQPQQSPLIIQSTHLLIDGIAVTSSLVSSLASMATFMDSIVDLPTDPPSLYLDLEGENLSREGSISIVTIFASPKNHVYLIDVYTLKNAAFTTAGKDGKTLKDILESATVSKVFFDVRNDSDALFSHYGIALKGIQDIQLMENAARTGHVSGKRLVNGLASCIKKDARMSPREKQLWTATKERGHALFAPVNRGSYQVFNTRPLMEDIRKYCVQDVQFLPHLRNVYWSRLDLEWKRKVEIETRARVQLSQTSTYKPHGTHKALGPWQDRRPQMPLRTRFRWDDGVNIFED
jgi:exonuclease 3'-5' domain-containing protein 1